MRDAVLPFEVCYMHLLSVNFRIGDNPWENFLLWAYDLVIGLATSICQNCSCYSIVNNGSFLYIAAEGQFVSIERFFY